MQNETCESHALATDPVSHGEEEHRSEQETCKISCGNEAEITLRPAGQLVVHYPVDKSAVAIMDVGVARNIRRVAGLIRRALARRAIVVEALESWFFERYEIRDAKGDHATGGKGETGENNCKCLVAT